MRASYDSFLNRARPQAILLAAALVLARILLEREDRLFGVTNSCYKTSR